MELRSYNVEEVFLNCLKSESSVEFKFQEEKLQQRKEDILSMIEQIQPTEYMYLMHRRTDGEVWTSSLQIIKMLVSLGEAIGYFITVKDRIVVNREYEK